MDEYNGTIYDGIKFLDHEYNMRCFEIFGPDKYHFRNPNNRVLTTDNKKHVFKKLPNY